MSESLMKSLHERRLNAYQQAIEIAERAEAEGRDLDATENEAWDKAMADMRALDERISELVEAKQREAATADAFAAVAERNHVEVETVEQIVVDEVRQFLLGERSSYQRTVDVRALASASSPLVNQDIADQVWIHVVNSAALLNSGLCTVIQTADGAPLKLPYSSADPSAALVTEGSAITPGDPTLGARTLGAYDYKSLQYVSTQLLRDSVFDAAGVIAQLAGRAVGNALGVDLAVGNGSSKPSGLMQTTTLGVTGATSVSGAFTADNLIDLMYSVPTDARSKPSAGWVMRDATVGAVRKLKDKNDQYLWQPGVAVGAPDLLMGKPVVVDPNIAAVATSAKSVAFGDLSAYWIRVAGPIRFERSDDYRFNTDEVAFRTVISADGILGDQSGVVKHFVGGAS